MRPVSERFLKALRGSHTMIAQALVVAPGQTGVTPTGAEVSIFDGNVQSDLTAAIRSTLEITTDGKGSFPNDELDAFTPYGNEIFVRRGILFGSGDKEWVSLGYFRIDSVEQEDAPNGPITISAQDRMAAIVEARLTKPAQFSAATTYGTVVNNLVKEIYPWATIQWDDLGYTDALGRAVICEQERYEFLNELITAKGKIWYWDHRGILVIKDIPPQNEHVWEVNAGQNGVLISQSREISRDGVYNAVVATGEALDTLPPPTAVAFNKNPSSPTYWNGSFGKVPRFYSSPFITTSAQAQLVANALLKQDLGLPYNVDFKAVPNPALEPYDAVAINVKGGPPAAPRVLLRDKFNRTVVDSWGVSDSGGTWVIPGSATAFDVTGGYGTVSFASANTAQPAYIAGIDEADVEGWFSVQVPAVATGAALVVAAATRYFNSTNFYQMRLEFDTANRVAVKISTWTSGFGQVELAQLNPIEGLSYSAGQTWMVRFRCVGTKLKMKTWLSGTSEPSNWHLEVDDSTNTSGTVGVWAWRIGGNTNSGTQLKIDEIAVSTYETLSVDAEVHVIEKLTIPLVNDQPIAASTREQTLVVIGVDDGS